MAFRFRRDEAVAAAVRRIVRERIDKAVWALQRNATEFPEAIHDARKRFKEVRSVLRLVRTPLGERYAAENRWYRDAGRALAAAREAQVALSTWEALLQGSPELHRLPETAAIRERLAARLCATREGATAETESARLQLLETLPLARERAGEWPLQDIGFGEILAGMRHTYRAGRRHLDRARESGDDLLVHEWRKRVKDLWHHTRMLVPVCKEVLQAREKQLKRLAEWLGSDHDLVVFSELARRDPDLFGSHAFRCELARRIGARQHKLRRQAYHLGGQLYADTPKAYGARLKALWERWQPS